MIIPTHLQIEPINGVCTARCTMCAFPTWTRKPYRMTQRDFKTILEKFLPYCDHLQYLSLQGFGESLLDEMLVGKVALAKFMGFKGIGFATNCSELSWKKSKELLEAGLDTLICSVDGLTPETHEAIRIGLNLDKILKNILWFMLQRTLGGSRAKVIIRFIKQKSNIHEWEQFKWWWEKQIDPSYGDQVVSFDIVDCEGKVKDYKDKDVLGDVDVPCVCDQLYSRMIVLSNGDVALCCADDNGRFNIGNVLESDPIEIYNGEVFTRYRRLMEEGRIGELELCNTCTIPRSQMMKDKVGE